MDLELEIIKLTKTKKTHIIIESISLTLLLGIIALFVIFSNVDNQIMMEVAGSITASLIGFIILSDFLISLLPTHQLLSFYKEISKKDKIAVVQTITNINSNPLTLRKGLSFFKVETANDTYFVLSTLDYEIEENKEYEFVIIDKFIFGVKDHE